MLETLRRLMAEFTTGDDDTKRMFADNDYRVAAAALLIHLVSVDGEPNEVENRKLHALLELRFDLTSEAADQLIEIARKAEGDAVDLYAFTSLINRAVDKEGRLRIVEMMWELAYADGRTTEFEENILWRAADLLHVSQEERIALKRRVAAGRFVTQNESRDDETPA